ncbi:MAG: c-type cytochrome, partial [Myxococcota bacterium]
MNRWMISTLAGLLCGAVFSFAAAADDVAAGKLLFETNCASCHGLTGKGDGPVGAVLTPKPRDFAKAEFKFDTDGDGTAG